MHLFLPPKCATPSQTVRYLSDFRPISDAYLSDFCVTWRMVGRAADHRRTRPTRLRTSGRNPCWRKGVVNLSAVLGGDVRSWESMRPPTGERARRARGQDLGHTGKNPGPGSGRDLGHTWQESGGMLGSGGSWSMLAVAATKGLRGSGVARHPRYASDPGATYGPKPLATVRNGSSAASRFSMIPGRQHHAQPSTEPLLTAAAERAC
jgi:hypothetical protein